jgi:salicylate hydroxylase
VASDGILIAGAGIGGLTAALALAQRGIGVTLFDQAEKLEEAGAGIQLSPNATRVLIALGLADRLKPAIVEPAAIRLRSGHSGREIATLPLGATTSARYGAPYWVIHRADLQKVLLEAVAAEPRIALTLGAKVDDFTIDAAGVRAHVNSGGAVREHRGSALIGADGLWSTIRDRLGGSKSPRSAARTAWRTVAPAAVVEPQYLEPVVNLWLGTGWHLVHYPIRATAAVNIVWVMRDTWESTAWTTNVDRTELSIRSSGLPREAAIFVQGTGDWQKWTLCDRAPSWSWGNGLVTLIGDAAHPMLPFLAQGAAAAIEDAAVLTRELARSPLDPAGGLRRYEQARQTRTARLQRAARRSDFTYHLREPVASVRDTILRGLGGERLLPHYDWIYQWRP